ncbi:TonB-dependent receptor [Sphingomonas sp. GCM10030256]|uniref:TonB-dependent receptor n=1 Tax=Sphingomonas sp. GCM10030256 TaxID=3273427 RepID=UPI003605EAAB
MRFQSIIRTSLFGSVAAAALAAMPAVAQDATARATTQEPGSADAQTAAEPAAASDTDIVVTARRREETLQDVPIAVTAYSGEQLERQGSLDITDIGDTTPNVTLEPSRGTNTTLTAFIRGVGQQDPVAGFEQGVGIYLDDVYLNRPQAAVLDIYDVERVEVLRGPQGTLYGRNTIGGAIKYVTRRLSRDFHLRANANIGTYGQLDGILSASTPVTDTLRVGAAVARLSRDGFGKNLTTGKENYNRDIWAGRASAEWEPTDNLLFRLSGDYTRDDSNPRGGHRLIAGQLSGAPVLDDEFDSRGGLLEPEQKITAGGIAAHIDVGLADGVTVRSITGYRKDKSATPIDFDALPAEDVDVPAIYKNEQFSQELQLLLNLGRFNGLVGGYFLDASAENTFDVILSTTGALIAQPRFTASTFGNVETETWALFGDFSYEITPQFSVSVGGRYTSDRREARVIRRNLRGGPLPELGGTPVNGVFNAVTNPSGRQVGPLTSDFEGDETFKEFTPRASVTFQPNDDNTLYASWSKGFKGGGFDPRGLSTAAPDLNANGIREADEIFDYFLFEPEKVTSYELGYKAALFDRRLRFAIAGFLADYKDVQVPGSVGAVVNGIPTFVGVTTNAGKAKFKGIEVEANALLARDFAGTNSRLNLSGTLGYLDAKYKEFVTNVAAFDANGNPAPASRAQPIDVADFRRIQNTPKWTTSGTIDMSAPLGSGMLSANATASYRSKTFQFETPSPFLDQPGYTLFDANLVYSFAERFRVGLHGKNLTDKRYITSGYQFLTANPVTGQPIRSASPVSPVFAQPGIAPSLGREGVVTAFYGNPRQLFVSFGVEF